MASPIRIGGPSDGATLRKPPNSDRPLQVELRALGAQGTVQWLLDGRLQGSSEGDASVLLTLAHAGRHTVTALARSGAFSSVRLNVVD